MVQQLHRVIFQAYTICAVEGENEEVQQQAKTLVSETKVPLEEMVFGLHW